MGGKDPMGIIKIKFIEQQVKVEQINKTKTIGPIPKVREKKITLG